MKSSPNQSEPMELELEQALEALSPSAVDPELVSATTSVLTEDHPDDPQLEKILLQLQPSAPSASLVDRITTNLAAPQDEKVISVPQWREFVPVFKVAAVLAALVGLSALLIRPPAADTSVQVNPTKKEVELTPIQAVPISQEMRRQGDVRLNEEQIPIETLKIEKVDMYFWDLNGMQVEDSISREAEVDQQVKTF